MLDFQHIYHNSPHRVQGNNAIPYFNSNNSHLREQIGRKAIETSCNSGIVAIVRHHEKSLRYYRYYDLASYFDLDCNSQMHVWQCLGHVLLRTIESPRDLQSMQMPGVILRSCIAFASREDRNLFLLHMNEYFEIPTCGL